MNTPIQCPTCGYTAVIDDRGRLPLVNEMEERCEFIIQQKQLGKVDDWMCPTLKAEVERILYGRLPKNQ